MSRYKDWRDWYLSLADKERKVVDSIEIFQIFIFSLLALYLILNLIISWVKTLI